MTSPGNDPRPVRCQLFLISRGHLGLAEQPGLELNSRNYSKNDSRLSYLECQPHVCCLTCFILTVL